MKKEEKKILLRLPVETWKRLEKTAKMQNRSVNGQIVWELNNKAGRNEKSN